MYSQDTILHSQDINHHQDSTARISHPGALKRVNWVNWIQQLYSSLAMTPAKPTSVPIHRVASTVSLRKMRAAT
jgi:hypothetical protein